MRFQPTNVWLNGLVAALVFGPACHAVAGLGTNLIANPGAEAGPGAINDVSVVPVPSWSTTSLFTAVIYGAPNGFPSIADLGPPDRGLNFFAGGPENGFSSASQLIDVAADGALIDAGVVRFDLSGYLGGFLDQNDNAVLSATFRDANLSALGAASIGPVTAANRSNRTGLLFRSTSGAVPVGTRSIAIDLAMTRTFGVYNDGYADNLSLILSTIPEPAGVLILATALPAALWRRQRMAVRLSKK